jgi:hypothetical protein
MQPGKEHHFRGYAGRRDTARMARGLLNGGRIRHRLQSNSMTLIVSQTPWEIAFKEGMVCSAEWENFYTAPMAVCTREGFEESTTECS